MRKGCAWVGLSVVAANFTVGFVGVESAIAAEHDKPTSEGIRLVRDKVQQELKKRNFQNSGKKPAQEQVFSDAWSKVNPDIAPFTGGWGLDEGYIGIYPSGKKAQVCMIFRNVGAASMVPGKVHKSILYLEDGSIYIIEKNTLVNYKWAIKSRIAFSGNTHVPVLFEPLGKVGNFKNIHPNSVSYRAADTLAIQEGCTSDLPDVFQKIRSRTIESLPDGEYKYKTISKAGEIYPLYFQKDGKIISAWYTALSEPIACYVGEVSGNSLIKGFQYIQGYGEPSKISQLEKRADFSLYTPLTEKDFDESGLHKWWRDHYLSQSVQSPKACKDQILVLKQRFDATYPSTKNNSPSTTSEQQIGKPARPPSPKPIVPVIAKPTYPSPATLAILAKQKPSGKPPSKTEEKELDDLRKQWRPKNPLVTPFIGGWRDPNGEEIFIYPSTQAKRICSVRAIGNKYDIQHNIVMGNAEGKDVLIGKTKQLFSLGTPNVLAIRDSKTAPLRQLVAIPGSPDLSTSDMEELEQRGCTMALPGTKGAEEDLTPDFSKNGELAVGRQQVDYPISINRSGVLNIHLQSLSNDADVSLIRLSEPSSVIASLPETGTTAENLRRFVEPGQYRISVNRPKYQSNKRSIKFVVETKFDAKKADDRKFKFELDFKRLDRAVAKGELKAEDAKKIKQASADAVKRWEQVIVHSINHAHLLINLKIEHRLHENPNLIAEGGVDKGHEDYLSKLAANQNESSKINFNIESTIGVNTKYEGREAVAPIGQLTNTIIHEIGHVLGINPSNRTYMDNMGTSKGGNNFVTCAKENGDVFYRGKYGVLAYQELLSDSERKSDSGISDGKIAQIRKCKSDAGKSDDTVAHWLDSAFGNEIMSAYVDEGENPLPLSKFTLSVLRDMGWPVNYGAADDYMLPKESRKPKSKKP
jgi:hypothetical protein